jgi:dimethylglycine dehydrogenase
MAQGYVPKELADETGFEIEIIGEMRKAAIIAEPLFDPKGERMRG